MMVRLLGLRLAFVLALLAGVATTVVTPAAATVTISVAPSLFEVAATPGGEGVQELHVYNEGDEPFDATTGVEPYKRATAEQSAVDWLAVEPAVIHLEPGEQATIKVTIRIPKEIESGGRYAAVTLTTGAKQSAGSNSAVAGKLGVAFLIAVQAKSSLRRYAAFDQFAPVLLPSGQVGFWGSIRNNGNLHFVSQGSVEIAREDGTPVARLDFPETTAILPSSAESIVALGEIPLEAGVTYRATARIDYGGDEPAIATTTFTTAGLLAIAAVAVCENADRGPTFGVALRNDGSIGVQPTVSFEVRDASGTPRLTTGPSTPPLVLPQQTADVTSEFPSRLLSGDYVLTVTVGAGQASPLTYEQPFRIGGLIDGSTPACAPAIPAGGDGTGESIAVHSAVRFG
jgi:hypothetical protein